MTPIKALRLRNTGTPWTPANLAAPASLWLDDGSAVTDAGSGACSQWNDRSGNGYHFVQSTSGERPLIISSGLNGRRVIDFDGTDDNMNSPSGALSMFRNVASAWAFAVYRLDVTDGSPTQRCILASSISGSASVRVVIQAGGAGSGQKNCAIYGGRQLDADAFYGQASATERAEVWVMALGMTDYIARTIEMFADGASDVSLTGQFTGSSNTSNTDALRARLGSATSASPSGFMNGKIAAVLLGVGLPGTTEIDKLFGYYAHHFGLAGNLPGGHPYKTSPPTI